ncbi:hypothetical protein BU16DRAFT_524860 [Lophium mytilinum]|uniref:Uncharacterized protein n=1 Tax=Lophium mytilinum TaxID=390894 RepID=A0A6A6R4E1_9PEZI|nr:hypothetical protein BU16DRAFT_524860 [Lophium mytilinum]
MVHGWGGTVWWTKIIADTIDQWRGRSGGLTPWLPYPDGPGGKCAVQNLWEEMAMGGQNCFDDWAPWWGGRGGSTSAGNLRDGLEGRSGGSKRTDGSDHGLEEGGDQKTNIADLMVGGVGGWKNIVPSFSMAEKIGRGRGGWCFFAVVLAIPTTATFSLSLVGEGALHHVRNLRGSTTWK